MDWKALKWNQDPDDRKSTSGYVCSVGLNQYPGPHEKNILVALSTLEAEYMSAMQ